MPIPTYVALAKTVLTGTQASVTFSSISSAYADLVLVASVRSNYGFARQMCELELNGVTASSYSHTFLKGEGTTVSSGRIGNEGSIQEIPVNANTSTTSTFGSLEIYIPNYTANVNKAILINAVQENNSATSNDVGVLSALFRNTGAITTILIRPNTANSFVSGSRFDLYGIKNS